MKSVFADTLYWIARVRPNDSWSAAAKRARDRTNGATLLTTDEVLGEFLTALSRGGPTLRRNAVSMVKEIMADPGVVVVPQTRDGFLAGTTLYGIRDDKEYSLVDCISMNAMRARNVTHVLTKDHHFQQEGFTILIE